MVDSNESSRVYTGRLVEHGSAPFENDPENQQSYFVRLRTEQGERTVWGVDLQRAIRDGRAQVGDDIVIEHKGREVVPVSVTERDAAGRATRRHQTTANRNRWRVTVQEAAREEVGIMPRAGTGGATQEKSIRQPSGGSIEDAAREPRREVDGSSQAPGSGVEDKKESKDKQATPEDPKKGRAELADRIRRLFFVNQQGEYRLAAQPQRIAFLDAGGKLLTPHDDPLIISGMFDVAEHKGWRKVNLSGSETFRRLAWLEAGRRGLEVLGFAPSKEDRKSLEEWMAEHGGHAPLITSRPHGPNRDSEVPAVAGRSATDAGAGEQEKTPSAERTKTSTSRAAAGSFPDRGGEKAQATALSTGRPPFDARAEILAQRVPTMNTAEEQALRSGTTEAQREAARAQAYARFVREGLTIRAMTIEEAQRYKLEWDAGRTARAKSVMREAASRQAALMRANEAQAASSVVVKDESMETYNATVARAKSAAVSIEDRDAVIVAVADQVLQQRRVGATTRERVAAAITRRLAVLREQGIGVSVLMYDPAVQSAVSQRIEISRSHTAHARSR